MLDASMTKIEHLIQLIRSQQTMQGSQEQRWIQQQFSDEHSKKIVARQSIISFHILSALENGEHTGIDLAKNLGVSRGGVTRAAKKLLADDLIIAGQHPDDRKKIFYSLTPAGAKIAQAHDQMHEEVKQQIYEQIGNKYSDQELAIVAEFLQDFADLEQHLNND